MGLSPKNVLRLFWCSIGVASGSAVSLFVVDSPAPPFLLASFGGSAIFLFGLTRAEAAQPRALFGGHLGGALIGIACYQLFGDAPWVFVAGEVVALWLMLLTRTVHPPAGANPIIMIHAHAGLSSLVDPVFAGVGALAILAALWSRLYPGLVHYPVNWAAPSPPRIFWGGWDKD